jgi:hypothetical protein
VPARTRLSLGLLQQHDWRFAITVFAECHRAGHNLWSSAAPDGAGAALLDVYEAIDQGIEEILAAVDLRETTVVLFSAHGMGRTRRNPTCSNASSAAVNATFWQSLGRTPSDRRSVFRLLRESVPPAVQLAISRSVPDGVRDWVVDRAQRSRLDWTTTPALAVVMRPDRVDPPERRRPRTRGIARTGRRPPRAVPRVAETVLARAPGDGLRCPHRRRRR